MKSLQPSVLWSLLIIFLGGSFAGGVFFGRSSHGSLTSSSAAPLVSSDAAKLAQADGAELSSQTAMQKKQSEPSISASKVVGAGQRRALHNAGAFRAAPEASESSVMGMNQIPPNFLQEELQAPGEDSSNERDAAKDKNSSDATKDKSAANIIDHIQRGAIRIGSIDKLPYEIRKVAIDQLNQLSKKGYLAVSDEDLMFLDHYHNYLLPIDQVEANLKFKLADIQATDFSAFKLAGGIPEGPSKEGPWSSVTRVFMANRALVMLREWAFVTDGGGTVVQKEMINENINGYPAVLLTKKAPSGRAIHELAWYSVDKMHVLLITSNGADKAERAFLKKLALAVPVTAPSNSRSENSAGESSIPGGPGENSP